MNPEASSWFDAREMTSGIKLKSNAFPDAFGGDGRLFECDAHGIAFVIVADFHWDVLNGRTRKR
jgi:hypothetical protein